MDPWSTSEQQREVGFIRSSKQYLLELEGLPTARVHDLVETEDGARALVTGLSDTSVEVLALDPIEGRPGTKMFLTDRTRQFYLGDRLLGRLVSATGVVLDGREPLPRANTTFEFECEAPGILERAPIHEQLTTGLPLIDTVLPIGKGQRELFMGSVRSGIEQVVRDMIINQEGKGMVAIYCSVGKSESAVRALASQLFATSAREYTVVVAAGARDTTPQNYIVPAVAFSMARYFERKGRDVLLVLDDLYTHAKYLREMALLAGRLPGRESYPGDIFYQHAHLIEQAGAFKDGATITLIPILQTSIEGYTDLITTNIMGTTDGHLSFSPTLFGRGHYPPVVAEESITRVGKHTQTPVQKQLGTAIVGMLANMRANEKFARFGGELSESVRLVLATGAALGELLSVRQGARASVPAQSIVLSLPFTSFLTGERDVRFFREHKERLYQAAGEHRELEDVRKEAEVGSSLQEFLKKVEAKRNIFEHVCQR